MHEQTLKIKIRKKWEKGISVANPLAEKVVCLVAVC